jgi:hypothetical protein
MPVTNVVCDPETLAISKAAFEEACAALPPTRATTSARAYLAECILKAAAAGERNPRRLTERALQMIKHQSRDGGSYLT